MGNVSEAFSFTADEGEFSGWAPLGKTLVDLGKQHPGVVAVAPDLGSAPIVGHFGQSFPERVVDCGIAECNAVSIAAGLAASGCIPYVLQIGAFAALKCAEQIRTDLAYTRLPVRILAGWSGLSMAYFGTSHHSIEDIAITRSITNLTVVSPSDPTSAEAVMRATLEHPGPVYFRFGAGEERPIYSVPPAVGYGRFLRPREGRDATIIATGIGVPCALAAAERAQAEGLDVGVLDALFLKPIDEEAILAAARTTGRLLTVEEHSVIGGLGTAVADVLARHHVSAHLSVHGLPDEPLLVASTPELYEHYGLTADGVFRELEALVARSSTGTGASTRTVPSGSRLRNPSAAS
ncbi:MAG: transketolase [Spirochaetaceae bacterium]|nr:transketolase family protein [Myxococcales bacterium]MCB9726684.1 transketolase [Spirochaetaceae bacterium]HPG27285.1 transketolase C-terminal domain-containing protein [Myxococcota bacterium]